LTQCNPETADMASGAAPLVVAAYPIGEKYGLPTKGG
jgi:hypothetical protein